MSDGNIEQPHTGCKLELVRVLVKRIYESRGVEGWSWLRLRLRLEVGGWSEESRVAKCNAKLKLAEKISLVGQHTDLWGLAGTI